jgi:hypothetical protein
MKARLITIVAVVLLLALAVTAVAHAHSGQDHPPADPATAASPRQTCVDDFRQVRGQGLSCRTTGGLWKVKHGDGSVSFTHGPDASPQASGQLGILGGTPRQPVCGTTYYRRAVIALPSDVVGDKTVASLRSDINNANGAFFQAAVESGSTNGADLIFLCDSTGAVRVDVVRLAHTEGEGTWSTIISDLKALGYKRTNEQYAVYYEATPIGATCGQGEIETDDTDGSTNLNNVGPTFAFVFDCDDGGSTLLHEIGHNLGAVQPGAHYSTGVSEGNGWHCYEAFDVMCYNDGGDLDPGYIVTNCAEYVDHFDCRHDSYFDAKIGTGQGGGAGSYIDTHWNIGACYVRWVKNAACGTTSTDKTAPVATAPVQAVALNGKLGATATPVRLTWSATDSGGSGLDSTTLWQSTDSGEWTPVTLPTATMTSVVRSLEPGHSYRFVSRAFDKAGNASSWAYGPTFMVDAHNETSSAIAYSTGWTRFAWASAYGGYESTSSTTGATAKLTFTGRNVGWVAPTASNRGQAYIYVDGVWVKTIDLYSATTVAKKVVFTRDFAASSSHTLTVKVLGTSGRPTVDVDAFVVLR